MWRFLQKTLLYGAVHLRAFTNPVDFGVAAVVEKGGRIVLVRHSYRPGWFLPGGAVGRGEPPADAVLRELREEIGLTHAATPQLIGLYTRRFFAATSVVALFRIREAAFVFKPNFEIRAITLADPAALPEGTSPGVARRFKELMGETPLSPYW